MIATLSPRDRRALLIGGVLTIALVLGLRGIPAWLTWVRESRAHAQRLTERMELARQFASRASSATNTADALDERFFLLRPMFLKGETPAQASASLASYVGELADIAGVQLGTVQLTVDTVGGAAAPSPGRTQDTYRVRIRVDGQSDIRGVMGWIDALESGSNPMIAIRTLSITQSDPAAPASRPEQLRVTLEAEGLARRDDMMSGDSMTVERQLVTRPFTPQLTTQP